MWIIIIKLITTMKKVLYAFAVLAMSLSAFSCGGDSANQENQKANVSTAPFKAEAVVGKVGESITMETTTKKMNGVIEFPGAITLTDTASVRTVISKLKPAQGPNTYNCAVLFTGTSKKGKIWNFTPETIIIDVEWKYEDGTTTKDQVSVESQKHAFSHADKAKGKTKTVTYSIVKK